MKGDEKYFIDTSALLPYYREEPASEQVQSVLLTLTPPVLISELTRVEFASAVARWVRMGELTEPEANIIENTFLRDIRNGLFTCLPVASGQYARAERWISTRKTGLRSLDGLHLACCSDFGAKMITCDTILHHAADLFGVENIFITAEK